MDHFNKVRLMKIIFIHIPKCAGRSVNGALLPRFPQEKTLKVWNPKFGADIDAAGFKNMDLKAITQKDLILGHIQLDIVVDKLKASFSEYTPITVVRDPLARVISLYHYIRRTKYHLQHEQVCNVSLHDFIISQPANYQSNYLVHSDTVNTYEYLNSMGVKVFSQLHLRHLFNYVSELFGENVPELAENKNPQREGIEIDEAACAQFIERNKRDYILYEQVLADYAA